MPDLPDLQADLTPAECAARLNAAMDEPWTLFGERPVIGRVRGAEARLRRRTFYRNSFHLELVLQLREEAGGTRIRGLTGMSAFALGFLCVWAGMMLLFMLSGCVGLLAGQASGIFVLVVPVMVGFMITLVAIGRGLGQGDGPFLMKFVQETLEAREIAGEPAKT